MTRRPRVTSDHSVTWDHSWCSHPEGAPCRPEVGDPCPQSPTVTCVALPDAYCRFGCETCEGGWGPGEPGRCEDGHDLVAHDCWVVPWVENTAAYDSIDGEPKSFSDGPIVVTRWSDDLLWWRYADEVASEITQ